MGCGSSVADRAIGLDGHDAVKQYVIEKNKKDYVQNYITEVYKNTRGNINRLKQKKLKEIDDHENDSKKVVQQVKNEIQKRQPGSVGKAQALHKKPAEQLLGLNQTLDKFEKQKHIVNDRYEKEQQQILREIREQYLKTFDKIQPSTSKLVHINALPEADRLKAFKWGDKYAQKEIDINNKLLKQQMDKKFDFKNFQGRFDSIAPTKTLNDIFDEGKQRATRASMKGSKCATC